MSSYNFNLQIENSSTQTLQVVTVSHVWDGNPTSVTAQNLGGAQYSDTVSCTSGPGIDGYDYYYVFVCYADGTTFYTTFFCNSSSGQNCVMQIADGSCNCNYFESGNQVGGCANKS